MASKAYLWGQIYGVIHSALPTGLSPGAKLNCSSLPGQHFGHYVALAELHRRPELERTLEALAGELSPADLSAPAPERGRAEPVASGLPAPGYSGRSRSTRAVAC